MRTQGVVETGRLAPAKLLFAYTGPSGNHCPQSRVDLRVRPSLMRDLAVRHPFGLWRRKPGGNQVMVFPQHNPHTPRPKQRAEPPRGEGTDRDHTAEKNARVDPRRVELSQYRR